MNDITQKIIVLVALILCSAYFSATETAFSSLNRIKLKSMSKNGDKKAKQVLDLCEKYDKLLSTILIGNNIVNILSASISTALFVYYFPINGILYSTIVMTALVLTFGEILPKSIAKEMPESFAKFSAPLIFVLMIVLTPINYLFSLLKAFVSRIFNIKTDNSITDRELLTIVEEAENEGGIDEEESNLLKSAIEFYELEVSDILTPRVDVISIDIESSIDEIKSAFQKSGFTRLPVYRDTVDNIIGIINIKDFFYNTSIKDIIFPAVFVLEEMKISNLVSLLKEKKQHIAVVKDEYGGTVGVVSLEDAIEELVGEIWDEHDSVRPDFIKLSDVRYRINGNTNIDKMFEIFDTTPDKEFESNSVSGWICEYLGHFPKRGERFVSNDIQFIITKIKSNRVLEILATKKTTSKTQDK